MPAGSQELAPALFTHFPARALKGKEEAALAGRGWLPVCSLQGDQPSLSQPSPRSSPLWPLSPRAPTNLGAQRPSLLPLLTKAGLSGAELSGTGPGLCTTPLP